LATLVLAAGVSLAQLPASRPVFDEFEVATIKPTPLDWQGGRYIRMVGPRQYEATNYTLRVLIAAAYSLNPHAVTDGPAWLDSDHFDIVAVTPGDTKPNVDQQMDMLRRLLADRFKLTFHREDKELPVYELTVGKNGPKLKESTAPPETDPEIINHIYPGGVQIPARNATMARFAAVMQRSIFDRPVLDHTGLGGTRYDFDLEWTPDESQFEGRFRETPESTKPGLFAAIQEQLGLRLEATKGLVSVLVIDEVNRPSEN
jgi:uncharacterized protein (TIGR03435 family)